jgi:predicted metal-dependent HD superfamily phosphohydrolase
MNYAILIEVAGDHVRKYMQEHGNVNLLYHNLHHTERVVDAASQIAHHYKLSQKDFFIVIIAAWFHDIGYYASLFHHEHISAQKAEEFLSGKGIDKDIIEAVNGCILATKVPQSPDNLLEEIVCDADLFHFGTDEFQEENKLMRRETEELYHIQINKVEWQHSTIELLENHHYHTDYCKDLLGKKKKQNLEKLKEKAGKYVMSLNPMDALLHEYIAEEHQAEEEYSTCATEKPGRSIETMFRVVSSTSQRLSEQADTKAHILISVNSIIISMILGVVVRNMEHYFYLTVPVIIILLVNLLTIIFSILSTMPRVSEGLFKLDDIDQQKVNLLFFGNFYRMNFDDYSSGMFRLIGDRRFLYSSLIRNIYEQGIVLGKKYRMLKVAYNVFMFGIVISVVAFMIAAKLFV